MNATNYLENKLIDHIFRSATFAKPAALYVALFTSAPDDAGGGTEVAGGGYARIAIAPGDLNWTATQGGTSGISSGTTGATANAAPIQFAAPSADWGTVTHIAICDAVTGGNRIVWSPLTAAKTILLGDPAPLFPPGSLTITAS
jgi:hypothetical protein